MTRITNIAVSDSRQQFTCCFCFHVRTGTIIFGISQIILQLLFISVLSLVSLNPDLIPDGGLKKSSSDIRFHYLSVLFRLVPAVSDIHQSLTLRSHNRVQHLDGMREQNDRLLTIHAEQESESKYDDNGIILNNEDAVRYLSNKTERTTRGIKWSQFSPYIAISVTAFSLAFCCFMVHGAVTHQPTHLLPFFFIQVFDLIIFLIHILEFMSSASDLRVMIQTKSGPLYIKSTTLTFIVLSISCLMLAFKAYCLGMVWDCYRYLMLIRRGHSLDGWISEQFDSSSFWGFFRPNRRLNRQVFSASSQPGHGDDLDSVTHRSILPVYDQSNDLPKYEDALKIPANAYAPPPYFFAKTANPNEPSPPKTGIPTSTSNTSSI